MGIPCEGRKHWSSACCIQLSSSIYIYMCSPMDWGWWVGKKWCLNARKVRYSNAKEIWVMRELKKGKIARIYLCLLTTCPSVPFELWSSLCIHAKMTDVSSSWCTCGEMIDFSSLWCTRAKTTGVLTPWYTRAKMTDVLSIWYTRTGMNWCLISLIHLWQDDWCLVSLIYPCWDNWCLAFFKHLCRDDGCLVSLIHLCQYDQVGCRLHALKYARDDSLHRKNPLKMALWNSSKS